MTDDQQVEKPVMNSATLLGLVAVLTVSVTSVSAQNTSSLERSLSAPAVEGPIPNDPAGLVMPVTASEAQASEPPEMIEVTLDSQELERPYDSEPLLSHPTRCFVSEANVAANPGCETSPCYSPHCQHCRAKRDSLGRVARIKACMQRTHWGYCNYFRERPFGESVMSTLGRQVDRGLQSSMMLYQYDFYPQDSPRAAELTERGRSQLLKIIERMPATAAPVQIEISDASIDLDRQRRKHVVDMLVLLGAQLPDDLVVLAPVRFEGHASEATETYENFLQSVITRGRTLKGSESATFGGR